MKKLFIILIIILSFSLLETGYAGTMGNYIQLANAISQLGKSNDPKAKAEAALASNVLSANDQTLAEAIMLMNAAAAERLGQPVFCPPSNFALDGSSIHKLTLEGLAQSNLPDDKKLSMPVATFPIIKLMTLYPCTGKGK